jgi:hypothetical protein
MQHRVVSSKPDLLNIASQLSQKKAREKVLKRPSGAEGNELLKKAEKAEATRPSDWSKPAERQSPK